MKEDVHRKETEKLHNTLRKLQERYAVFEEERALLPSRRQAKSRQLLLSKQLIKVQPRGRFT